MQTTVWKKQTDVMKQLHIVAALLAVYGDRAVFVDGRIDRRMIELAVESGNIKHFFNRRFHDKGVDWQRVLFFQTTSTRRSGPRRRGVGNLHFHALFVLPERQTYKQMRNTLKLVFGNAEGMAGEVQFKFTKPDWQKGYTFNQVRADGPLGKILYVQQGMGATYNDLKLNSDGKRSRKAPIERLRCNRHASGLAKGVPSHFNAKATLVDHVSTEMGRKAFVYWVALHREEQKELKRRQAREALVEKLQMEPARARGSAP